MVGTPEGIEHFTERHDLGLFSHEEIVQALASCGLDVRYDPESLIGRGLYTAVRPG